MQHMILICTVSQVFASSTASTNLYVVFR